MRQLFIFFLLFLSVFVFTSVTVAQAQEKEIEDWDVGADIFKSIQDNSRKLRNNQKSNNTKATRLIDTIELNAQVLNNAWGKKPTPESFLESLKLNAELLEKLKDKDLSKAENFQVLQDVADDLRIKAAHCKTKGWANKVSVTVNTKKSDGTIVSGQEVFFVSVGMARNRNNWKRFSQLSSPTNEERLNPGVWIMRVKEGENVRLEIGEGASQIIDLIVP